MQSMPPASVLPHGWAALLRWKIYLDVHVPSDKDAGVGEFVMLHVGMSLKNAWETAPL